MPNPAYFGAGGITWSTSWPAVTSLDVSRPGGVTAFDGMMVGTVVIGRDGSHSPDPIITPPAGFTLDWLGDYSSDSPYPSMMAIFHKPVLASALEPSSFTWVVSPARSMNAMMMAVKNSIGLIVAPNSNYTGNPGDPQYVRDPGVIRTGTLAAVGPLHIAWFATVAFGPQNEFGGYQRFRSSISSDDDYSTRLFTAGTYYICVAPYGGASWDTSEATIDLRITHTSEVHSIGRRAVRTPDFTNYLSDTVASANTITDPIVGDTLIRTNITSFHDNSENPSFFTSWFGDSPDYTGWLKLVLTQDMWLAIDTFGSGVIDTLLFVFDTLPSPATPAALYQNDDEFELPYSQFNGADGLWGYDSLEGVTTSESVRADFFVQQGYVFPRPTTATSITAENIFPDFGSPRRVGVMISFLGSLVFKTAWPYIPGSVTVDGTTANVIETNSSLGLVTLSPYDGSHFSVSYQSAGTNPIDIYPDVAGTSAGVPVMRANGLSPGTP